MTNAQRFFTSPAPSGGTYAPSTIGAPAFTHPVDISVFKQTPLQKEQAANAKFAWKKEMKQAYGKNWRNEDNPPGQLND